MKRIFIVFLLLMCTGIIWISATENIDRGYAHLIRGSNWEKSSARLEKGLEDAGASSAQIAQVLSLVESTTESQEVRHMKFKALQTQIQDGSNADIVNRSEIVALIREAGALLVEGRIAALDVSLKIQDIVGEEIWSEMQKSRKHRRFGGGHGRRSRHR